MNGSRNRVLICSVLFASLVLSVSVKAAPDSVPSNASIEQLHAALSSGRLTSERLVQYYLERIDKFDKAGPRINALISINPNALSEARSLDADRDSAKRKGLLYGIPFIAKDNYDTAGMATTGGSAVLRHSVPAANAFVVQELLDQGAILLGKANLSELAASYGRLGYSSAGGLTLNPYNTSRNVSGSSSGSAAAVAADFAAFALGTDTSGSLRGPASVAGLVGLRPTLGLTSRAGVIPLSLTCDTTGALTRNVRDAAAVLAAISGADPQDAATLDAPRRRRTGQAPVRSSLEGVRLGVITNFRGAHVEVDGIERAVLDKLAANGATLIPVTLPKAFENLWNEVLGPVGEAEFKPQFERYLATLAPSQPKTLAQFIDLSASAAGSDTSTPINPLRLEGLRKAEFTHLTDSAAYIRILTRVIPELRLQLQTLLDQHQLRAFVFSTLSCPASPRFDRDDASYHCGSADPYQASYIASATGFPEVTLPVGQDSANVPVGYSLMGKPYSETALLALAQAVAAVMPGMPPPDIGP